MIFEQKKAGASVKIHDTGNCIVCGHCVAACPTDAVCHGDFPAEKVHPVDAGSLPSPQQVLALCRSRRSNRALNRKPVPEEFLERIIEAAHRAPTASNMQQVAFTLVTDPGTLRKISEFTLGVFGRIARRLSNPLLRPWLSKLLPGVYRYLPALRRMKREFEEGRDRILRGATAVLVIHLPEENRFGSEDANLAYQNASLMAEALGVSQIYMGFVMMAVRQDKDKGLHKMLGLEGRRIGAVMALGMPEFRYPNYIDRKPMVVTRI